MSNRTGSSRGHLLKAFGQRGWKRQPEGMLIADGTSPLSSIVFRFRSGSGTGIAESKAWVYGCKGFEKISLFSPSSIIFPRYMMAILSDMYLATARS